MSDVLEQARHLVAYADKRGGLRVGYLTPHGGCVDIARALIETQQGLDDARALAQQVLAEHRIRGAALTAACGADESVRMARDLLASIETKGDGEA